MAKCQPARTATPKAALSAPAAAVSRSVWGGGAGAVPRGSSVAEPANEPGRPSPAGISSPSSAWGAGRDSTRTNVYLKRSTPAGSLSQVYDGGQPADFLAPGTEVSPAKESARL